jgi:peptide/nickel transport system substrate-binding protein
MTRFRNTVSRRNLVLSSVLSGSLLTLPVRTSAQTPAVARQPSIVVDTAIAPATLDPALARSAFDWSIIHSIYDSILNLNDDGEMAPLAASSFSQPEPTVFEVVLREGLVFHDGTPVLAGAIERSVRDVQESDGPAARNFGVIERVDLVNDLTARLVTAEPAPWLPSQLAVWLALYPEGAEAEFETVPVGSGPYRFSSMDPGMSIVLARNETYFPGSPKGAPLADTVTYRFVPEVATRMADLATGATNLVDGIGQDQESAVADAGADLVEAPVLGIAFLRIVNDVPPLDDPRVRQAINHAIDVESIAQALVSTQSHRTASLYPDARAIGFDPDLEPFAYDPDLARALLEEAGVTDRLNLRLQYTGGSRDDVMEAIAANLADAGIDLTIETTELTTFNGTWQDPDSAELRFVTWRPVYDPHTLLSLMFASTGPLSRFADDEADSLIVEAAREPEPDLRAALYQQLGRRFQESPPAAFLWNLTASYGVRDIAGSWAPRSDEYIILTGRDGTT